MGSDENFIHLLEVYNILIKVDTMSSIKSSIIRLILDSQGMIETDNSENLDQYEISLNVQEILSTIIGSTDLNYAKDQIKRIFTL